MGITGLLPFLEKASRKTNVSEFSGCTVAVDAYCWLHKGAFACADKLARGEETDIHIRYCMKYVTMLLSKNIKPILVFDGQRLPAKAHTEAKRRESRNAAKKRAIELLKLGKSEEARAHMRRSVDVTHAMALALMAAARARGVDCLTAPYEADAQLGYLATRGFAHLVISEDSDLILFGCERVLYKMDLEGSGTLVEAGGGRLARAVRWPAERYSLDKLRHVCILAGCDYLPSLPGVGLARARAFLVATHDADIANALKKLPGFLNKPSLQVTDQYRSDFLRAEATFKHQPVYDPCRRALTRLLDPRDEGTEEELLSACGAALEAEVALQLCAGNLDLHSLRPLHAWHPDTDITPTNNKRSDSWKECPKYPSIWSREYSRYLNVDRPWQKKKKEEVEPIVGAPTARPRRRLAGGAPTIVPETQDDSVTIESLSSMYCVAPVNKRNKLNPEDDIAIDSQHPLNRNITESQAPWTSPRQKSPILQSKNSFRKSGRSILGRLSRFPRTILDDEKIESKFFSSGDSGISDVPDSLDVSLSGSQKENENTFEESMASDLDEVRTLDRNSPRSDVTNCVNQILTDDDDDVVDDKSLRSSCTSAHDERSAHVDKVTPPSMTTELSPQFDRKLQTLNGTSPLFQKKPLFNKFRKVEEEKIIRNPFRVRDEEVEVSRDSLERTRGGGEPEVPGGAGERNVAGEWRRAGVCGVGAAEAGRARPSCKAPGLQRAASLPSNQPTLLAKFGFQKKAVLKK